MEAETDQVSKAHQPFHTNNAILAFCLWRAGVPFWEPKQPCMVVYTLDMIRKFVDGRGEPVFKGWDFDTPVVKEAHKRGFLGRVTYIFIPTERLKTLLMAFKDQEEKLREAIPVADIVKTVVTVWSDGMMEDDEALLRLACIDLKTRVEFMELWRKQVPCIEAPNEGEVVKTQGVIQTKDGPRVAEIYDHPGVRVMSVNASKETRERLGL